MAGRSGRSSCRGLLHHWPDPGDEPAMLELLGVARLPAVDDDLVLRVVLERPDLIDLVPFGDHDVGAGVPEVMADLAPTMARLRPSQVSDRGQIGLEPVTIGLIVQDESKVGEHGHPIGAPRRSELKPPRPRLPPADRLARTGRGAAW